MCTELNFEGRIIKKIKDITVRAYVRVERLKETLVLVIANEEYEEAVEIARSKALDKSGKAYINKLGDFIGLGEKKKNIDEIVTFVRAHWNELPRTPHRGYHKVKYIYNKL